MNKYYEYFYGNKVSDYGIENGYVDYATLAKSFDAVFNNDIMSKTFEIGYWEQVNGFIDHSEEIDELQEQIDELQEEQEEQEEQEKVNELQEQIDKLQEQIDELQEEQDNEREIFQYYIISDNGADILKRETNEIVYYNEELDMYVWGVTHWGTSWNHVLTDIALQERKDN